MAGKKRKAAGTSPYFEQPTRRSKRSVTVTAIPPAQSDDNQETDVPSSAPATQHEPPKKRKRVAKAKAKCQPVEVSSIHFADKSPPTAAPPQLNARKKTLDNTLLAHEPSPTPEKFPVSVQTVSSGNEDDSDSDEDVDWEEVPGTQADGEVSALLSGAIPVEKDPGKCLAIDIDIERGKKRRSSKKDLLDKLLDKMMREKQLQKHKVHLLCLVANSIYISSICNQDLLQGFALSLLPAKFVDRNEWSQKDISNFLTWFASTFSVSEDSQSSSYQMTSLLASFHSTTFASRLTYVLGLAACLRVLHLSTRLTLSLQPVPLKWTPSSSSPTPSTPSILPRDTKPGVSPGTTGAKESRVTLKVMPSLPSKSVCSLGKVSTSPVSSKVFVAEKMSPTCSSPPALEMQTVASSSSISSLTPAFTDTTCEDHRSAMQEMAPAAKSRSKSSSSSLPRPGKRRSLRCVALNRHSKYSSDEESESSATMSISSTQSYRQSGRLRDSVSTGTLPIQKTNSRKKASAIFVGKKLARTKRKASRRKESTSEESESVPSDDSDSDFLPPSQTMRSPHSSSQRTAKCKFKLKTPASQPLQSESVSSSSSDSEEDFKPSQKKLRRSTSSPNTPSRSRAGKKAPPSASTSGQRLKTDLSPQKSSSQVPPAGSRISPASRRNSTRETAGINCWLEVYCSVEKTWQCIDPVKLEPSVPHEVADNASQPVSYVIAVDNTGRVKDVTQRYARDWMTRAKRRRVDATWWQGVMTAYAPLEQDIDMEEDLCLQAELESLPLPTSVQDFKGHPLYVLQRHLLKFEALYPADLAPIGFIRSEAVYPRSAVHTLHTRETWLKEARSVKEGEEPYKMVKARPKRSTPAHERGKLLSPTYGYWQTEDYVPPTAVDGKVPRNTYGNVELFKPSMLPFGCRHIQDIPNLPRIARKLGIDCAEAMVGWDQHSGYSHPIFDGVIVCEEFADALLDAWEEDRAEGERKAQEKREKRIMDRWYKLTKGLLIQQRVKRMFSIAKGSAGSEDGTIHVDSSDNSPIEEDCGPAWSALQSDTSLLPGHRLPS